MSTILKALLLATGMLIGLMLLIYCGSLFYLGSCDQIKNSLIPMYAPNRCIK